jgi:hypothetical protein
VRPLWACCLYLNYAIAAASVKVPSRKMWSGRSPTDDDRVFRTPGWHPAACGRSMGTGFAK